MPGRKVYVVQNTEDEGKGFSLVELLIVLSIIAALIATITPIALNAARKAKATKISSNIKLLADSLERIALTDGVNADGSIKGVVSLASIARDVADSDYRVIYYNNDEVRTYRAYVVHRGVELFEVIKEILGDASSTTWGTLKSQWEAFTPTYFLNNDTLGESEKIISYHFSFYVYE